MLPEVGGLEWLIIAVVALIVVGPKDLPPMLRKLGQFVAKMRSMASEFRASFDEMARQSELDDLRKEVEAMRRGQFADMATQTADLDSHARTVISDIEQSMADVGVHLNPPAYQFNEVETAPAMQALPQSVPKPRKPRAAKADKAVEVAPAPKPRTRKVVATAKAQEPQPRTRKVAAKPKVPESKPTAAAGSRRRSKIVEGSR